MERNQTKRIQGMLIILDRGLLILQSELSLSMCLTPLVALHSYLVVNQMKRRQITSIE